MAGAGHDVQRERGRQPHLILGLVWQIVKCTLLSNVNLKDCPFLVRMLRPGEDLEELLKLPPEKLLMRCGPSVGSPLVTCNL